MGKSVYQTAKNSLRSVAQNERIVPQLSETSEMITRIHTHTLFFVKSYILKIYEDYNNNNAIPEVDQAFILNVMRKLCVKVSNRGRPPNPAAQHRCN